MGAHRKAGAAAWLRWLCRPLLGRAGRTKPGRRAGQAAQAGLGRLEDACIAASKAINLHTDNGKCEMPDQGHQARPGSQTGQGPGRGGARSTGRRFRRGARGAGRGSATRRAPASPAAQRSRGKYEQVRPRQSEWQAGPGLPGRGAKACPAPAARPGPQFESGPSASRRQGHAGQQ